MTGSHRNEDRGGERRWTFNGVEYPTRKLMCAARREEYVRLLDEEGMNFTQAAHAVGVSKRTGKAWRNGRTRATGGGTKGQAWTGVVPPWTNPNGSTRATSIRRSASRSPTGCARAIRSAPPPGCRDATPARSAARSSATGIPGPATARPAAPGRRRPAGSNAPNRARRPTARRCGRGYRPGCAGIGARSR